MTETVIGALIGASGVAIGSLLTGAMSFFLERQRLRKDELRARYQDRLHVYSGILHHTHPFRVTVAGEQMGNHRG